MKSHDQSLDGTAPRSGGSFALGTNDRPATEDAASRAPTETAKDTARSPATIMVVDDDPNVRLLACEVLRRSGYTVAGYADPLQAIHDAGLAPRSFELLLTDIDMPAMNGGDLFTQLAALVPDLKVVFMSGSADGDLASLGVDRGDRPFLKKPFTVQALTSAVRKASGR